MSVEVLLATMNQEDMLFLKKMNIQSDIIIGNQCNRNEVTILHEKFHIQMYSFKEKGVGLNRNNILMRAKADYCLIADDDMTYVDGYVDLVERAFKMHSDADVIIFNVYGEQQRKCTNTKSYRVNTLNFMRFGAVRIAVKRKSIHLNGIFFNLTFGGGTEHSNGEDTLFLWECLRHKLKIYAVPEYIATLNENSVSTWFRGYNDKYLKDKGILYKVMFRKMSRIICLIDAIKYRKRYDRKILDSLTKLWDTEI